MLTLKDCYFTVFDPQQETLRSYFSSQIEILLDAGEYEGDFQVNTETKSLDLYSPKFLSVRKPRFVKNISEISQGERCILSLPLQSIFSVDFINK